MTGTASKLKDELGEKISTFTFDYSKWSADWPTNANVSPCLADYVNAVSAAYRSAGGDGEVVLVAHSMGGIAVRYASSSQYVQHPITADVAPLVISLDTPYLGSQWGGSFVAGAKQLWGALSGRSVPNPFGTDGATCLQPHNRGQSLPDQCGGLPPWLAGGTTLDEIGGNITIRRTILGIHLYDVQTGSDGIVKTDSSEGYLTSGPEGRAPVLSSSTTGTTVHSQYVDCSVDTGQIHNFENDPGGVFASLSQLFGVSELSDWAVMHQIQNGQESPAVWLYSAAAIPTAGCSHTHIPTDPDAVRQVAADISAYVNAHPASNAGQINLQQIAAGDYTSLEDKWTEEAYATNGANGGWRPDGTDTLSISRSTLASGNLRLRGSTLTYDSGNGPVSLPVAFHDNGEYLDVSLKSDNVVNWELRFYPKGTVDVAPNNGVTLDRSKNTIYIWTSNNNYTEVFAQDDGSEKVTRKPEKMVQVPMEWVNGQYSDGTSQYTVKIWARTQTKDCASIVTGQIAAYVSSHHCASASRILGSTTINGRPVALSQTYFNFGQPPKWSPTDGPPPSYGYARGFTDLAVRDGTGDVRSLLDDGDTFPGSGTKQSEPYAFDAGREDGGAEIAEAWYLDGPTPENDPPLVDFAKSVFLHLS